MAPGLPAPTSLQKGCYQGSYPAAVWAELGDVPFCSAGDEIPDPAPRGCEWGPHTKRDQEAQSTLTAMGRKTRGLLQGPLASPEVSAGTSSPL